MSIDGPSTEWLAWPLAEQIFGLSVFLCLAPGVCGVWLICHHAVLLGTAILLVWLLPFAILLRWLHRRKSVRLTVSLLCSAVILLAALLVS
jgi:hypothetical protein